MEKYIFIFGILCLSVNILLCMIRAIKGPDPEDRLLAVNVVGTKVIALISIVSFILNETYFVDVVLVYALINFIGTIVIADFVGKTGGFRQ